MHVFPFENNLVFFYEALLYATPVSVCLCHVLLACFAA